MVYLCILDIIYVVEFWHIERLLLQRQRDVREHKGKDIPSGRIPSCNLHWTYDDDTVILVDIFES